MHRKECENCQQSFDGKHPTAKYCSDHCREMGKNKKLNAKWLTRKTPDYSQPPGQSNRIDMGATFYCDPKWVKKRRVMRG